MYFLGAIAKHTIVHTAAINAAKDTDRDTLSIDIELHMGDLPLG
jgi:hypothetical protein